MFKYVVTAASVNIRSAPSLKGGLIGMLSQGDTLERLDISEDKCWYRVMNNSVTGWIYAKYLQLAMSSDALNLLDRIYNIVDASTLSSYKWKKRGVAPRGFIAGMALVFAKSYHDLLNQNEFAIEMAKANTSNKSTDALAYYEEKFHELGMDNESSGEATLRHLFTLLLGLGMRESSGRWCEGRDISANNTTSQTAEAGLFQTSWNARAGNPLMHKLFDYYRDSHPCYLEIFQEDVAATPRDLENYGAGDGEIFQGLTKKCPIFAVEFAAIGLRNIRKHWGPINRYEAELRREVDDLFLCIQDEVDPKISLDEQL